MELLVLFGFGKAAYPRFTLALTALNAVLAALILYPVYRRDHTARIRTGLLPKERPPLSLAGGFLLLFCGAGLAQYGNILLMLFSPLLPPDSYAQEMALLMKGKSFAILAFYLGILAPIGEEVSFRLLLYLRLRDRHRLLPSVLISSLVFGLYHGNLLQAVYASLLGCFFALGLELTGSPLGCLLLHMGANIWSLVLSFFPYQLLTPPLDTGFLMASGLMIAANLWTFQKLSQRYKGRGCQRWQ